MILPLRLSAAYRFLRRRRSRPAPPTVIHKPKRRTLIEPLENRVMMSAGPLGWSD